MVGAAVILALVAARAAATIDPKDALLRACDAANEYDAMGAFAAGASLKQAAPRFATATVFDASDRAHTDIACFRIPSAAATNVSGTLVLVAEARHGSCADCSRVSLVAKRSTDHGRSWGALRTLVPGDQVNGNPTLLYDPVRDALALYYARGAGPPPPVVVADRGASAPPPSSCIPAASNWLLRSHDGGLTWGAPREVTPSLAAAGVAGALPGPGNAAVGAGGRYVVPLHYGTAERAWGLDALLLSDDGGETHRVVGLGDFPRMDEANVAATIVRGGDATVRGGDATVGATVRLHLVMRNAHNNASCACKALSTSDDNGETWSPVRYAPALLDPICQASAAGAGGALLVAGPDMAYARARLTLWWRDDDQEGGRSAWNSAWNATRLADETVFADYTSLVVPPPASVNDEGGVVASAEVASEVALAAAVGVAWGACAAPLPFRVWCLEGWEVRYTRVVLAPAA
jgi:sialidase-1